MADIFLITKPRITEKATKLNQIGQYVFLVKPSATKPEVRKLVKQLYKVDPVAVNIVNLPPKTKRYRNVKDKRGGYKKAIVTLSQGQKIDIGV